MLKRLGTSMVAWSALMLGACAGDSDGGGDEETVAIQMPDPSGSASVADGNGSNSTGGTGTSTTAAGVAPPPGAPGGATESSGPGTTPAPGLSDTGTGDLGNEPVPTTATTGAPGAGTSPTPIGGAPGTGAGGTPGAAASGGSTEGAAGTSETASGGTDSGGAGQGGERLEGVSEDFSFFVTSYYHIAELSGSADGFGGNLSYGGKVGIEGADAICQEMASRVGFNNRTWRAYLSTSTVNAKDRVGTGPWYDFAGNLVAENVDGLLVPKSESGPGGGGGGLMGGICAGVDTESDRPLGGALDCGTYDELGLFHDGSTDQNNDGIADDDHDTMTATLADGTYAGFSCEDWTSTTATFDEAEGGQQGGGQQGGGGPGLRGGIMMGHSWAAGSGMHWTESHGGHACGAGTNFIQNGPGDSGTVGGGGGYGGFFCFALAE